MTTSATLAPAPAAPLDTALRADPIEFIRYEHYRQRALCDRLGRIADDLRRPGAAADAAWVVDYLSADLTLHIADEAEDLLPLLRERCRSDGRVRALCDTLDREHERDQRGRDRLLDGLRRLAARRPVADAGDFVAAARAFQDELRRHVLWENQTLLPLARKALWTGDLESLGLRMARRHGHSGRA
jgi:hemerythrin-like domain-containing protein